VRGALCTILWVLYDTFTEASHELKSCESTVIIFGILLIHKCLENTNELFVPPNPKLLDTATPTSFSCASFGTKLNAAPTSGFCRFNVAGTTPFEPLVIIGAIS